MQRLVFILYQMDEARRYMESSKLEQLRLGLVLLDNAAELILDGRVAEFMQSEGLLERIRAQMLEVGMPVGRDTKQVLHRTPLTKNEKWKLSRYFEEKVTFLAERRRVLDRELGSVLVHLHGYRNEAYHEAGCVSPSSKRRSGSSMRSSAGFSWTCTGCRCGHQAMTPVGSPPSLGSGGRFT